MAAVTFPAQGQVECLWSCVCVSRTSTHSTREEVANGSHKITIDYSAEVTHVVALTVTHELDHELDHVNHLERDRLPNGHQPYGHWSARVCFVLRASCRLLSVPPPYLSEEVFSPRGISLFFFFFQICFAISWIPSSTSSRLVPWPRAWTHLRQQHPPCHIGCNKKVLQWWLGGNLQQASLCGVREHHHTL